MSRIVSFRVRPRERGVGGSSRSQKKSGMKNLLGYRSCVHVFQKGV